MLRTETDQDMPVIDPLETTNAEDDADEQEPSSNGNGGRSRWSKLWAVFSPKRGTLKESLEEMIEEHDASGQDIAPEERALLQNVLDFSELRVWDIMIPQADIVYVKEDADLKEFQEILANKAHTRIPVCKETIDEITGFVHVKDLMAYLLKDRPFKVKDVLRDVLFIPPSMKLNDLLVHMRLSRVHIAIVIDEFGGTKGLVTMENLMEEIVGEIHDEHDDEEENVVLKEISATALEVSARMKVRDLEERFELRLQDDESEDFDTVGGMIFSIIGRIPVTGEVVTHPAGLECEVVEADPRRVKRVIVRKKKPV